MAGMFRSCDESPDQSPQYGGYYNDMSNIYSTEDRPTGPSEEISVFGESQPNVVVPEFVALPKKEGAWGCAIACSIALLVVLIIFSPWLGNIWSTIQTHWFGSILAFAFVTFVFNDIIGSPKKNR